MITSKQPMPSQPIQIYIIDDEPSVCVAYARLVRSANMEPHTFASVEDFMKADFSDANACVISDIRMPGTSGIELPGLLAAAGHSVPVIFVTANDAPETRDRALRAGATAFFHKPVDGQALLDAISWTIENPARPIP